MSDEELIRKLLAYTQMLGPIATDNDGRILRFNLNEAVNALRDPNATPEQREKARSFAQSLP